LRFLSKFPELIIGLGNDYAPASDDNRLLGFIDELGCFLNLSWMSARDNSVARQINLIGIGKVRLILLDISRYVNKNRSWPSCLGNVKGLLNSSGQLTKLCLVIGIVMPVMSISWKASLPITDLATWPVIATIGAESI
jgi:hypothetical protein